MDIAYIISAYKYPQQLIRLVNRLQSPDNTIFLIHVDKRTSDAVNAEMVSGLRPLPNVHFLPRHGCHWGDFGHVQATIKGIDALFRDQIPFDYAILLTGQDYPIKPHHDIVRRLDTSNGASFMDYRPLPWSPWRNGGRDRYELWHFWWNGRRFSVPSYRLAYRFPLQQVLESVQPFIPVKRAFPHGYQPFGGCSYWCLARDAVEYIYQFTAREQSFVDFFRRVLIPDELFFQTILLNSPLRDKVVNDHLRYMDWSKQNVPLPAVLDIGDLPQLEQSPALFARKFDVTVDSAILDMIDERILDLTCAARSCEPNQPKISTTTSCA